jgi:hypothetical protein
MNDFGRMVTNIANRTEGCPNLRYDESSFSLVTDDSGRLSLQAAYHEYCRASAAERNDLIDRILKSCISLGESLPSRLADVRDAILPQIRSRTECDLGRLREELSEPSDPCEPYQVFGEHLAITLVLDRPTYMLRILRKHLDDWGISFDEALHIARDNLLARSDLAFQWIPTGLWASRWEDNYDAARMLLPQVIQRCRVRGTPIVTVATLDSLMVAGSEDLAALEHLCCYTSQELDSALSLSGIPFQLENGTWTPFVPSEAQPLYRQFRSLWVKSLRLEYRRSTKPLMSLLFNYAGETPFVSALFSDDEADLDTHCCWTEGIDSLLPKADVVYFESPAEDHSRMIPKGKATWEHVQRTVGNLLEPLGCYPERYRARQFPDAEQQRELFDAEPPSCHE